MLEVKNLTKVYSGKGGVEVRALDNVSVTFPEKGMVFLLGRSGSGKSTLLNVAGGLDKPDGGEVIVKGRSSKDFSASDFDSYRNTFIGFVFQEYNILNEFTIEQNIALALQLQSKPNNKAAVDELLEKVDLAGYGKRKPNTLSGGQKQRVAIARALIKEPEIIMADEPTGALDSNTGKQVLDTLKKLSETKLVIVVSHDRDFAEFYGDRIIELKDGKIISDVEKYYNEPKETTENVSLVSEDTITVKNAEKITADDLKQIALMLKKAGGEAVITAGKRELPDVKRACRINDNGSKESFKDTGPVDIVEYDGKQTKFIKSRLPMGHAIRMGASGLKSKPIRLIFTIILAVAAFVLFGVVSTFMLYDSNYSISEALIDAGYPSIRVEKSMTGTRNSYRIDNTTGEKTLDYSDDFQREVLFGASEVKNKNENGLSFAGVYHFSDNSYSNGFAISVEKTAGNFIQSSVKSEYGEYYLADRATGFTDCGADYLQACGFTIAGTYPATDSEIMITSYMAELFVNTDDNGITRESDLLGKRVKISGEAVSNSDIFTISGIVTTGTIPEKYQKLKTEPQNISARDKDALTKGLEDYLEKGFFTLIYVAPEFYDRYAENISHSGSGIYISADYYEQIRIDTWNNDSPLDEWSSQSFFTEKVLDTYGDLFTFSDLSGEAMTYSLKDGEVLISSYRYNDNLRSYLQDYMYRLGELVYYDAEAYETLGESGSDTEFRNLMNNMWDSSSTKPMQRMMNEWYNRKMTVGNLTLAEKKYYYTAADKMRSENYSEYDAEYGAALNRIAEYKNYNNSWKDPETPAPEAPTTADWTALKTAVDRDLYEKYPQLYYYMILEAFPSYTTVFAVTADDDVSEDVWSINNNLSSQIYDGEGFAKVKAFIDAKLTALGLNANDMSSLLEFDSQRMQIKIYYTDKGNNHGTLKVVGYFSYGSDWSSADYFVTNSWVTSHGKLRKDTQAQYTWTEEYETEYVAPKDAKYNAIISLSDNSQAQITAALAPTAGAAYTIDNSVSEELMNFLELILDLEQIFLYVGLGVGVIAALFLLNFISVSIAAKRKDIGILRAVGARGSDVFKIFYAEAFIIAFICFLLACVGSFFVCFFLNRSISEAMSMKLLNFGPLNAALIFGVSIFVSLIATFFPVYFAAKKSPVESIRAL